MSVEDITFFEMIRDKRQGLFLPMSVSLYGKHDVVSKAGVFVMSVDVDRGYLTEEIFIRGLYGGEDENTVSKI